ncbi:MAG: hypothetical protein MUQ65_03705 [Armatimonadetes bacterium]|nr:hypothetical protein [Armatimonadota bacterium]
METLALLAATLAATALIVVSVKAYLLMIRAQAVVDGLGRLVESELTPTVRAWGETARGVQDAARKLDEGLGSLARTLGRVDRISERLEPEVVTLSVIQPAVAKVVSWLGGVRKGLGDVVGHRPRAKGTAEGVETEVG